MQERELSPVFYRYFSSAGCSATPAGAVCPSAALRGATTWLKHAGCRPICGAG